MKKLSELNTIRVIAVLMVAFQCSTPVLAADNIEMVNNQPVAVVAATDLSKPASSIVNRAVDVPADFFADQPITAASVSGPAVRSINIATLPYGPVQSSSTLPLGWTRAASNVNFAFQVRPDAFFSNNYLYLKNLNTGAEIKIGGGSISRHNPSLYDVSPDGQTVVVGYRESGPLVGQLSEVCVYRIIGNVVDKIETIPSANAKSISFGNGNVSIVGQVRGPNYNGTTGALSKTYTFSTPSLPAGWTRAASNPNFAFQERPDSSRQNIYLYLRDLTTGREIKIGGGSSVRHNPALYDISPDGRTVVASYRESGPLVGQLSEICVYRLRRDYSIEKVKTIQPANAISVSFVNGNARIVAQMRGPNYNGNTGAVIRTFTISTRR